VSHPSQRPQCFPPAPHWSDGDSERFAQLFDVVSRYAERQQNIKAGAAAPMAAAPLGPAATTPASPSTSWDEELGGSG